MHKKAVSGKRKVLKREYYLDYLIKTQRFPQSLYHHAKHRITEEFIIAQPEGSLILDAACGIGNVTAPYCERYQIVGIDSEISAVEYCKKHLNGSYFQADLYKKLPFKEGSFDLILFHDSIEHFHKPMEVLGNLARVLKRGGIIIVSTINYANPLWLLLENTWHRLVEGSCKTYSKDVHPARYTPSLLLNHCSLFFKEIELRKEVFCMELFFVGRKS